MSEIDDPERVDRPQRPLDAGADGRDNPDFVDGQGAMERLVQREAVVLEHIDDPHRFDPQQLRGMPLEAVRAAIPSEWVRSRSNAGGGEKFADPLHAGRQIRLMPGYEPGRRPDPVTHGPYAVVSQNSPPVKVPLAGNPELT